MSESESEISENLNESSAKEEEEVFEIHPGYRLKSDFTIPLTLEDYVQWNLQQAGKSLDALINDKTQLVEQLKKELDLKEDEIKNLKLEVSEGKQIIEDRDRELSDLKKRLEERDQNFE